MYLSKLCVLNEYMYVYIWHSHIHTWTVSRKDRLFVNAAFTNIKHPSWRVIHERWMKKTFSMLSWFWWMVIILGYKYFRESNCTVWSVNLLVMFVLMDQSGLLLGRETEDNSGNCLLNIVAKHIYCSPEWLPGIVWYEEFISYLTEII